MAKLNVYHLDDDNEIYYETRSLKGKKEKPRKKKLRKFKEKEAK
tara:strand:- start:224 stop:355 length:132 start_codon:yes stop_codon:yes gene_type:complete